ncbi:MAG: hypothetical protein M3Z04_20240 [Chloroflexota bacterium]|nr:hypothetical protein [Chloroflexota bacterium]
MIGFWKRPSVFLLPVFVLLVGCGGQAPAALPISSDTGSSPTATVLAPVLSATPSVMPAVPPTWTATLPTPTAPATLGGTVPTPTVLPGSEPPTAPGSQPPIASHGGPVRDYVSLIDTLRAAGLTVIPTGAISQPFFTVKGQSITVQTENVQVFEYADAAAAAQDAARVAPDGGSVGTTMLNWVAPPHFYRQAQLIVLYVGQDATVLAALATALGPPFAGQ